MTKPKSQPRLNRLIPRPLREWSKREHPTAKLWVPPGLWKLGKALLGVEEPPSYQGVVTGHDMSRMHQGRFAEINDRFFPLDPYVAQNVTRMRHYLLCFFADYAKNVEGDFLTAGVSFGVAPRVIYDFVQFEKLGKTYHLVDPFLAIGGDGTVWQRYNTEVDYVRRQYAQGAPVRLHQDLIPDCFPLDGLGSLAFVHLNTGAHEAEARSLPYLYKRLSRGGVMVIDNYTHSAGYNTRDAYDPTLAALGVEIFSMVTGQGVFFKF